MRFFAGLSVEELAQALHLSENTVIRDYRLACAWLRYHLFRGASSEGGVLVWKPTRRSVDDAPPGNTCANGSTEKFGIQAPDPRPRSLGARHSAVGLQNAC